jgi:uncharacterized protein YdeI (YjbR/CyaY-like superfamily)
MEMAYRERWRAEIAELQRILSGFDLREECKWGKPCYTRDGVNVVIIQGFKDYCALGFFQGALLDDPKRLLVQAPAPRTFKRRFGGGGRGRLASADVAGYPEARRV